MKAEDWAYLAEGNRHIVLRFATAGVEPSSPFEGKILRIGKDGAGPCRGEHDAFQLQVLQPYLTPKYVHNSFPVSLTSDFLRKLMELIDPLRPPGRRSLRLPLHMATAHIEPDLTALPRLGAGPISFAGQSICVEIKVKCGLKPSSPLIDICGSNIKLKNSKYSFMQLVKCAQDRIGVTAPWGSHIRAVSEYDPAEICSGEFDAVRKACRNLVDSPQNNFIVYDGGEPVYGLRHTDRCRWLAACRSLSHSESCNYGEDKAEEIVLNSVAFVLCREDALRRLQLLQALDVLDVDGAAAVLDQLCLLLDGDQNNAMSLVDRCMASHSLNPDLLNIVGSVLSYSKEMQSALEFPSWNSSLDGCTSSMNTLLSLSNKKMDCSELFAIEKQLISDLNKLRVTSSTPALDFLIKKQEAQSYIARLDKVECVLLLRLWLISLGACDASIMLCLNRIDKTTVEENRMQNDNCLGICVNAELALAYSLRVIDIGPKPASKIVSKAEAESKNCELASREEKLQAIVACSTVK